MFAFWLESGSPRRDYYACWASMWKLGGRSQADKQSTLLRQKGLKKGNYEVVPVGGTPLRLEATSNIP